MNEYLKVFIVIFLVWSVYSYVSGRSCGCNREGFLPKINWTGRDLPSKQCLNNCTGIRHDEYRQCAANCNQNNQFRKHYYLQ